MNPLDWQDAVWRQQRNVDPNHHSAVSTSMGDALGTNNHWDVSPEQPLYALSEPHNSMGVYTWERPGPPSCDFQSNQLEISDPDGDPLEMDVVDPELARKRKELKEIEEQIIRKKVSLALKTVEPCMKALPSEQPVETLRDRVNVILQQRHSLEFLSKVKSASQINLF